jgi:putative oxidoreductase
MITRYRNTHTFALLGRILLSCIFLVSAYAKVADWSSSVQMMEAKGIPGASILLLLAVLIEAIGGLMILTGFFARIGATALFLYLIPVTIIFHSFWDVGDVQRNIQLVSFLKNLAIMGGLAMLSAFGPGRISFGRDRYLDETYVRMPHRKRVTTNSMGTEV